MLQRLLGFFLVLTLMLGVIGVSAVAPEPQEADAGRYYCGAYNICKSEWGYAGSNWYCDYARREWYVQMYWSELIYYWSNYGWIFDHLHHDYSKPYRAYTGDWC